MTFVKNILAAIGLICVSGLFIFAVQADSNGSDFDKNSSDKDNDYNVYALSVPKDLNFAG